MLHRWTEGVLPRCPAARGGSSAGRLFESTTRSRQHALRSCNNHWARCRPYRILPENVLKGIGVARKEPTTVDQPLVVVGRPRRQRLPDPFSKLLDRRRRRKAGKT